MKHLKRALIVLLLALGPVLSAVPVSADPGQGANVEDRSPVIDLRENVTWE